MNETKSINKVNLFGNEVNVAFNLIYPVGVAYPQYPGFPSPMDMWGEFSTWEVVKYGGAFFRTEGGNAKDFLEPMPATTSDGLEFTVDWASIPGDDQDLFVLSKNFNIGDFVAVDGEFREIKEVKDAGGTWITTAKGETDAWSGIYGFRVDAAFTEPSGGYQNITKVVVLQKDTLQDHQHSITLRIQSSTGGYSDVVARGNTEDRGSYNPGNVSSSYRAGKETRGINSTFKIWKRVS